jgi:hypothetical protein
VFQLQFNADTTKCVGVPAFDTNTTVRLCSSGNNGNVNWALIPDGQADGAAYFYNTNGGYLSSDNALRHQLFLSGGCPGCYLKWTVPDR